MNIKVEDNIFCKVYGATSDEENQLYNLLSYKSVYRKPKSKDGKKVYGKNKKPVFEVVESDKSFYNKTTKRFMTGFLKRVTDEFDCHVISKNYPKIDFNESNIEMFDDVGYQTDIVDTALNMEKGLFEAVTGSGKTVIMLRLIKAVESKMNVLVLCHDKDIHTKNYAAASKVFDAYWVKNGSDKGWIGKKIVFSMAQTFKNAFSINQYNYFDMVMIDEVHRASNAYRDIFFNLNARFKFGFTGTLPKDKERRLFIEGLTGPVLKELSNKDIEKTGRILPIKVKLFSPEHIEFPSFNKKKFNYQDIYEECIVNNAQRNKMIKKVAKKNARDGLSSAIFTKRIQHAENLSKLFKGKVPVLTGESKIEERNSIRDALQKKEILIVIVNIWKEGVDIPSLNCAINAFGGKAFETAMQVPGRAIRADGIKEHGILIDFLDPWRYLNSHALQRLRYYNEKGWI